MGNIGDRVGIEGVYSDEFLRGMRLGASTALMSFRAMVLNGADKEETLGLLKDFEGYVEGWTNDSND